MRATTSTHILILGLALFVVGLGAYTRLSDSGLGCPDWPACYGHWYVQKNIASPQLTQLDTFKAWTEMIHRYVAGFLGLLIFGYVMWRSQELIQKGKKPPLSYAGVLGLLIVQALFGMWTVTWKLHPMAVMPHLMGGMGITVLLATIFAPTHTKKNVLPHPLLVTCWLCSITIACQIMLGGWTSANYAALVCPDFPTCQGNWLPSMHFLEAFSIPPIGPNYDGGAMSGAARTAIHISHRIGGIITAGLTTAMSVQTYQYRQILNHQSLTCLCLASGLVVAQITLGIANIVWLLPIQIAVAHNVCALLIALIFSIILYSHYQDSAEPKSCGPLPC